ncbi:MAG: hypothetical protein IKJ19_05490 [Clostridia bacterium]|nr:hypothetical protein [Clostridia bacterium]
MKKNKFTCYLLALIVCFTASFTFTPTAFAQGTGEEGAEQTTYVAKVGNTEYSTIDEAIAKWTNGTTLTLLADVTLSDVISLSSTEHHILDLSTYTMTAASKKDAIQIVCNGQSSETYCLTINADATNPGGITATGKACIYYKKTASTKDRPITRINEGIFNGSYSVNFSSSNSGTNCPTLQINGGTFNSYFSATKCKLIINNGIFNASINCTGDSTAYRHISLGKFKQFQFLTADAVNKFGIGSNWDQCKAGNYDRFLYVDKDGYLNVVNSKPADLDFEAKTDYSTFSSYLKYSSAAANGLYYEKVEVAIEKANKTSSSTIQFFTEIETLDVAKTLKFDITDENAQSPSTVYLTTSSSKFILTFNTDEEPTTLSVISQNEDYNLIYSDTTNEDGTTTRTYSLKKKPTVANIGTQGYTSLQAAYNAATNGATITLTNDVEEAGLVIEKDVTIDLASKTYTINNELARSESAGLTIAEGYTVTIKNGTITGYALGALVDNYSNLTIENLTIDGTNADCTLSNKAGASTIKDSTIIASENGVAFDICEEGESQGASVTVDNSTINGLIKLTDNNGGEFAGSLIENGHAHTSTGNYIQTTNDIQVLDEYAFTITLDSTNVKANESVVATISLNKDFYSADWAFTYNSALFACDADTDNDGVIDGEIEGIAFEGSANQALVSYTLVAKNDISGLTSTSFAVSGHVVQYYEQSLNSIVNAVTDDTKEVSISLDCTVEVKADYVQGYSLIVVKGSDAGYSYNGEKMYYVESYEGFAILVEGAVSAEEVALVLSKASDCVEIVKTYDVNASYVADGKIDLKDATAVYACSALDFDVASYMELFLRADVNNDYKVNMFDINLITANYTE